MIANPVIRLLGRRLRLGLIGGGPDSFIGQVHQNAARLDGCYDIVTGVLSSSPDRALTAGRDFGFGPGRLYSTVSDMLKAESERGDGIDVVAIMTPNDSHYKFIVAAMEHGIDVICDKPLTKTLDEAVAVAEKAAATNRIVCLTHNYSGYPMVRQAKAMVADGQLGSIRLVQVEYVQGARASETIMQEAGPSAWRYRPEQVGESLVLGDIGSHAHHLMRFVTGLEIAAVCADVGSPIPHRSFQDTAGALLLLQNGARGMFWVTQAATGVENQIRLRVSGSLGTLEWELENPSRLIFKPSSTSVEYRTPGGPGSLPLAARACRIAAGHAGGFVEAFATIYRDAAEAIASRRAGIAADPLTCQFPNAQDGLEGLRFIHAVIASSRANGQWVNLASNTIDE